MKIIFNKVSTEASYNRLGIQFKRPYFIESIICKTPINYYNKIRDV